MNNTVSTPAEHEKLLYKLVIQFLIFSQGRHRLLEPHLLVIRKRLKTGSSLQELTQELQAISKTLLHISKQDDQNDPEGRIYQQNTQFLQRLDDLLIHTSVPLRFQQRKAALRQKVKADGAGNQSFNQIIDSAINLLLDIKDYSSEEQKDIDIFLSDLAEQLSDIEHQAELVGQSARLSLDHRAKLNSEINLRLDNIKDYANQAYELASLKAITSEHLNRLMSQLLTYKQLEDERQQQAERQMATMTEKLRSLEIEADTLRTKLRLEHDRALCDSLTGLPNRLAYKDRVEIETSRWQRYHTPLSLIIWDIDYFKRINDNYGHKAGDKTLSLVAQLLLNNCRASDFVARYGGEEFLMLLPNTKTDQALKMAENIRDLIQNSGFNYNGQNINLTLSGGICEFLGDDKHDQVFVRADRALYHAKQSGRNRCEVYQNDLEAQYDNYLPYRPE